MACTWGRAALRKSAAARQQAPPCSAKAHSAMTRAQTCPPTSPSLAPPTPPPAPRHQFMWVENTADDPSRRRPDITKAKTLLGWEPKVGRAPGGSRACCFSHMGMLAGGPWRLAARAVADLILHGAGNWRAQQTKPSMLQASRELLYAAAVVAVARREVTEEQVEAVRVRPGLPMAMRLQPGPAR